MLQLLELKIICPSLTNEVAIYNFRPNQHYALSIIEKKCRWWKSEMKIASNESIQKHRQREKWTMFLANDSSSEFELLE